MRTLAVILALAIVPGSQALVIREAPFAPHMYKMEALFYGSQKFVIEAFVAVSEKIYLITKSKIGKAVLEQFEQLTKPLEDLQREIPTEMTEAAEFIFDIPWEIVKKVYNTLIEIDQRASPNFDQIFDALAAYLEPTLQRLSPYIDPLVHFGDKILELDQDLNAWLTQTLESLDGPLSFYIKGLKEIREALQPLADSVGRQFRLGLESLNKNLKPYLQPFLEEIQKYREAFKEWIESPVFPPPKSHEFSSQEQKMAI